jgi:hypothetical protein
MSFLRKLREFGDPQRRFRGKRNEVCSGRARNAGPTSRFAQATLRPEWPKRIRSASGGLWVERSKELPGGRLGCSDKVHSPCQAMKLALKRTARNPLPERPSRDLHSSTQALQNNFYEALDVYRISRILTNGSRLSHKATANQGIHSRVSGGSSA